MRKRERQRERCSQHSSKGLRSLSGVVKNMDFWEGRGFYIKRKANVSPAR
jgi:hypothetical protein